jgi:hypothetical protein
MPIYKIKDPSGKVHRIKGPEGATMEQLVGVLKSQIGGEGMQAAVPTVPGAPKFIPQAQGKANAPRDVNLTARAMEPWQALAAQGLAEFEQPGVVNKFIGAGKGVIGGIGQAVAGGAAAAVEYLPDEVVTLGGAIPYAPDTARRRLLTDLYLMGEAQAPKIVTGAPVAVTRNAMRGAPVPTAPASAAVDVSAIKGLSAAETPEATLRQTTAAGLREPVPLTRGQVTQSPTQLEFEKTMAKKFPETTGRPLVEQKEKAGEAIIRNFDKYIDATGAEKADMELVRPVGRAVDKALVEEAKKAKFEVDKAFTAARQSPEADAQVPYTDITSLIERYPPTTRSQLASILDAVDAELKRIDPMGTGKIRLGQMEEVREYVNRLIQPDTPNAKIGKEIKTVIDNVMEASGGEKFRTARSLRARYAKYFENASYVSDLLSTKAGSKDRAVALDDIFKHSILDGSLEDTRAIGVVLKKGGEEAKQAWKELQGLTLAKMRDEADELFQKVRRGQSADAPLRSFQTRVRELDRSGKLEYLFGTKGAQEIRDTISTVETVLSRAPTGARFEMRDVNVPEMKEGLVRRLFDKIGPYTPLFGSRIRQGAETRAKLREAAREKEIARQETQMLEREVQRAVTPNSLTPSNVNRMSR